MYHKDHPKYTFTEYSIGFEKNIIRKKTKFVIRIVFFLLMDIRFTWIYCIVVNLLVPNMILIYWSVRSSSMMRWDAVNWVNEEASYEHHFIRVHETLVQHPSNNISDFIHTLLLFLISSTQRRIYCFSIGSTFTESSGYNLCFQIFVQS